jgi:hypothetical protein
MRFCTSRVNIRDESKRYEQSWNFDRFEACSLLTLKVRRASIVTGTPKSLNSQYAKITKVTKTEKSHAKTQSRLRPISPFSYVGQGREGLRQSGFNTISRTNILGKGVAIRISAPVKNPYSLCAFAALCQNFLSASLRPW